VEQPLSVVPIDEGMCGLTLTHDAFPDEAIRYRYPEGLVYYDEDGEFRIFAWGNVAPDWHAHGDGTLSHRRRWEDTVDYEVRARPTGDVLALSATVTNVSVRPMTRIELAPCIQLGGAGSLDDPAMARTFYHADGEFVAMNHAHRPNDPGKNQVSVTSDLGFRWSRSVPESDYGWGMASPDADAGLVAVLARAGRGGLATWWQRVATVCNNAVSPIHCVHAEPYFDTLAPGESGTVRGELTWSDSAGLKEFWSMYEKFRRSR